MNQRIKLVIGIFVLIIFLGIAGFAAYYFMQKQELQNLSMQYLGNLND